MTEITFKIGDTVTGHGFFERGVVAGTATLDDGQEVCIVRLSHRDRMWGVREAEIKSLSNPTLKPKAQFRAYLSTVVVSPSNLDKIGQP